ncbi:formin-like protein 14 [Prunus yedoensis var. nudiflora]|uniref:Formin-like protein 14 n=1 Tax=Prunus yedoensis var. nudiflora TaxID=2094558 RepID=A0A314XNP0_PRUYE|nr:formin-like protein 14 [Prunus yedoensis var. nudiflora]
MNILLLLFAFLPIIVVPAHARILSESAGGKLALIITIYGRTPQSPPPPPSSSPPTHHSTIGATAFPPPAPPRTKPIGQGTSYERTRSPPPSPKPAPSHGQLGSSTSPCKRIISTVTEHCVRKPRSPPPSLKLFKGSDYENARSPPPPPKDAPSHGELGSTSPWNRIISIATDYGWIKLPRSSSSSVQDK